jgi:hypothetical protein
MQISQIIWAPVCQELWLKLSEVEQGDGTIQVP